MTNSPMNDFTLVPAKMKTCTGGGFFVIIPGIGRPKAPAMEGLTNCSGDALIAVNPLRDQYISGEQVDRLSSYIVHHTGHHQAPSKPSAFQILYLTV